MTRIFSDFFACACFQAGKSLYFQQGGEFFKKSASWLYHKNSGESLNYCPPQLSAHISVCLFCQLLKTHTCNYSEILHGFRTEKENIRNPANVISVQKKEKIFSAEAFQGHLGITAVNVVQSRSPFYAQIYFKYASIEKLSAQKLNRMLDLRLILFKYLLITLKIVAIENIITMKCYPR